MSFSCYIKRNPVSWPIEPDGIAASNARHFAVIPVFDENENIAASLASVKQSLQNSPEPIAVLLVVNEPPSASSSARNANAELLQSLRKNDGKYDGGLAVGKELFFIDLTDKEIPHKFRTVGNARKIGFDGILGASDGKVTKENSLFFSLDADTLVAGNYFSAALAYQKQNPAAAGAVYYFEHRLPEHDKALSNAVMRYEIFLLDYAEKLFQSKSLFNFWTIGSAFFCTARDYVRCGGMRRHAAGEDFYFLQALRKVGAVGIIAQSCVYPAGRVSDRVPFGTGPAIARQLAGNGLELYNSGGFELLRDFFTRCGNALPEDLAGDITALAPAELKNFLDEQNFAAIWQKILRNTPRQREKLLMALQTYCDGFFILKFCHYLETAYPDRYSREKMYPDSELTERLADLRRQAIQRASDC